MSERFQAKLESLSHYSDQLKELTNRYRERGAQIVQDDGVADMELAQLRNRVTDLERQLLAKVKENSEREKHFRERIAVLERTIAASDENLASSMAQIAEFQRDETRVEAHLIQVQQIIQAKDAEIFGLRERIGLLEAEAQDNETKLLALSGELQDCDRAIAQLQPELASRERQIEQLELALQQKERESKSLAQANVELAERYTAELEALRALAAQAQVQAQLRHTSTTSRTTNERLSIYFEGDHAAPPREPVDVEDANALQARVHELERDLVAKQEELNRAFPAVHRVAELEAVLRSRERKIGELEQLMQRTDQQSVYQQQQLNAEIQRLEAGLEEKTGELARQQASPGVPVVESEVANTPSMLRFKERADRAERELQRVEREFVAFKTRMHNELLDYQRLQVTSKLAIKNAEEEAEHYRHRLEDTERERTVLVDDLRQQLRLAEEEERRMRGEMLQLTEANNLQVVQLEVQCHTLQTTTQSLTAQLNRAKAELEIEKERRLAEEDEKKKVLRQLEQKLGEPQPIAPVIWTRPTPDAEKERRIEELQLQLQANSARLSSALEAELTAKEQLESLTAIKVALENDVRQLNLQLQRTHSEAEHEKVSLRQQQTRNREEFDELLSKHQLLQQQKTQQFAEHQQQVKELQQALVEKALAEDSARHALEEEMNAVSRLQQTVSDLRAENDRLRADFFAAESELTILKQRFNELEAEAARTLIENATNFEEQKGQMLGMYDEYQRRIREQEAEIDRLRAANMEAASNVQVIIEERDSIRREYREHIVILEEAQTSNSKLNTDLHVAAEEHSRAIREKEEQLGALRRELWKLQEELTQKEQAIKVAKKEVGQLQQQASSAKMEQQSTVLALQQRVNILENLSENHKKEVAQLLGNVKSLSVDLAEKESTCNEMRLKTKEAENARDSILQEKASVETELQRTRQELAEVESEARKLREERDATQSRLNDLEDRMQILQTSLNQTQSDKKGLEGTREGLESSVKRLQHRLESLQQDKQHLEATLSRERELAEQGVEKLAAELESFRNALAEAARMEQLAAQQLRAEKEETRRLVEVLQQLAADIGVDVHGNNNNSLDTIPLSPIAHHSRDSNTSGLIWESPGVSKFDAIPIVARVELYPCSYRDYNGKKPSDGSFIPPCYDQSYRDAAGHQPGEAGFVPPSVGTRGGRGGKSPKVNEPLPAGCYDENYLSSNGLRPGDRGFIPPLEGVPDIKLRDKALGPLDGFDEDYRDSEGRAPGQSGFVPPCYTDSYRDANGRKPGDLSFVPPPHGSKGSFGGTRAPVMLALDRGCYDENYRDANGRKPGDRGFIPILAAQEGKTMEQAAALWPEGYDDNYRDASNRKRGEANFVPPLPTGAIAFIRPGLRVEPPPEALASDPGWRPHHPSYWLASDLNGRYPGQPGFVPHGYNESYRDAAGRAPGEAGFVPPSVGTKAGVSGKAPQPCAPLPENGYDENYVDGTGKRAGDRGFVPPLGTTVGSARSLKAAGLPDGFDQDYRDAAGRDPSQADFVPPCYNDRYLDHERRHPGDEGFIPPPHGSKGTYGGTRMVYLVKMKAGAYDENYRDINGRKPGDRGFIPIRAKKAGKTATLCAAEYPHGYDDLYVDANHKSRGEEGFMPPRPTASQMLVRVERSEAASDPAVTAFYYDETYADPAGLHAGDMGFLSPITGRVMEQGAYDAWFVDTNGLKAGDSGFVPPLTGSTGARRSLKAVGLVNGFDADFRDVLGRAPGMTDFIPPCYDSSFTDKNGQRVGDEGFLPPPPTNTPVFSLRGQQQSTPLPVGCYDEGYRDANGRKPGDRGFIPPLAAREGITDAAAAAGWPEGFDENYRDHQRRSPVDPGFERPLPTGLCTALRLKGFASTDAVGESPTRTPRRRAPRREIQEPREYILAFADGVGLRVHALLTQLQQIDAEKTDLIERLRLMRLEQNRISEQFLQFQDQSQRAQGTLEEHAVALTQENALLREEGQATLQQCHILAQQLESMQHRSSVLEEQLVISQRDNTTVLARREQLVQDSERKLREMTEEIARLSDAVKELREVNSHQERMLRSQNQTFEEEAEKLKKNYERRLESLENSRQELMQQIQRLQEDDRQRHANSAEELQELLEANRQKDACIDKLSFELQSLSEIARGLTVSVEQVDGEQRNILGIVRTAKSDFNKDSTQLKIDIQKLQQTSTSLAQQNAALQEQQQHTQETLQRVQADLKKERQAKETAESELMTARMQRESTQEKLRSAVQLANEEKRLQITTLESQIQALQNELAENKHIISDLRQQIEQLKAQRRSLQEDNGELNEAICQVKREQEENLRQLRFEVQRHQAELKKMEASAQHKEMEIEHLNGKLKYQAQQILEQLNMIKVLQETTTSSPVGLHPTQRQSPARTTGFSSFSSVQQQQMQQPVASPLTPGLATGGTGLSALGALSLGRSGGSPTRFASLATTTPPRFGVNASRATTPTGSVGRSTPSIIPPAVTVDHLPTRQAPVAVSSSLRSHMTESTTTTRTVTELHGANAAQWRMQNRQEKVAAILSESRRPASRSQLYSTSGDASAGTGSQ
eukprot:TRINITY_DN1557_c0_g1_i1.p1 TRINITY_DN1557_c0_g1~~TRINITY_DN1557_c0_g1_i1.p1  ORF type:complete len:2558 (-),score=540.05 TRINITY_DN1557_c0_g1_i1:129-7802(-)